MEKEIISTGRRPKSPLLRRIWKDMLRDWKRYSMICLILILTIGFVSGMFVANNSMLLSMENSKTDLKREDGHFRLSVPADEETLSAIEKGGLAEVKDILRERAYSKAEGEVRKAVDEAVHDNVEEQVKAAILEQVTSAVDMQLSAAKNVPEKERQDAIDKAYIEALDQSFDETFDSALSEAMKSDEYDKAFEDAMDEAKKEIDRELGEQYDRIAEKYGLDEETEAVPVKIHPLFCKDTDEILPSDSSYTGRIRVYGERRDIDLFDIIDGRAPENEKEIIIDRMHADNAKIKVGDTIKAGGADFEVVGLAYFADYSALYENNTDMMFDALTFNVGMTTDDGLERAGGDTEANYAFTYDRKPADEYEEKEMSENLLKALITQTAVSETEDLEIEDFVPAYANQALTFAENDMGKDKIMAEVLLYILTAVLAFIFAVNISATLENESSVIGTLRASGYSKGELLKYYMGAPLLIVLIAAGIGNILGYTVFKNIVVGMYYNTYSLPTYTTTWTPEAFIRTTAVPTVLMLVINLFMITKILKLSPLRFLRHDLKKNRRKKAVRLPHCSFFSRFRMRIFLQNIPSYIMLFVGITFVMLLISMAVGMPETLSYYQKSMPDMVFAEDQLILSSTEDEDGNTITTDTEGAERFSITSLERKSDIYTEEVTVYGIIRGSRYVKLGKTDERSVYISESYAEKYDVKTGDTITLSEKFEHRDYEWTVCGIYDYSAGVAVFMDNDVFNSVFDREEDSFNGYMADRKINDIDIDYIAREMTSKDMIKVADQLDHSMGSYMTYFQYVCFIVAAIILWLLTKMIIEKNERSISMAKILGYENGEIASLYLLPTAVVVLLSEFLAMYLGFSIMAFFWKMIMMQMSGWFAFVLPASGFVKEFLLVFAAYLLITVFDVLRIRRVPKVLALKNME
jgi:putative ABC transport system permease protein